MRNDLVSAINPYSKFPTIHRPIPPSSNFYPSARRTRFSSQFNLNSTKNLESNPYLPFSRLLLLGCPHLQIFDLIVQKFQKPITQLNSSMTIFPQNFLTTSPASQMGPKLAQKLATHTLSEAPSLPTD